MANIIKKILVDPLEVIHQLSVNELEDAINYAADKYYNTNKSIITDAVYDLLIDTLKMKAPKSDVLKNIGAVIKSKNKVPLDYWLGSMDKIKPIHQSQFDSWLKKYKSPYYLSDKLDGISALLVYKKTGEIKLFTRGTATEGQDITVLIKYLNLPTFDSVLAYVTKKKIDSDKEDNLIALRGELIINKKLFEKNWHATMKNARNAVAGLVNSKKINANLAKDTHLVLYEVVDPFLKMEDQYKIINDLEFKIVKYKKVDTLSFELLSKYLRDHRENNDYVIDGIIVSASGLYERNTSGNPEYAFAFKDVLDDQTAKSTIIEIEWNASKNGYLVPTIIIEPVSVGGVEIKRISAHNARYVVDNKLGIGAKIEIIRSGDVIPKIHNVIKAASKIELPKSKWHWNETEVDIILDNMKTDDIQIKNIYAFFSTLDAKGVGEKNVEKMYLAGLNTVEKILKATESDFLKIDTFKEKTATNLVASIKECMTNINLAKLMAATNTLGEGIGYKRMKQVLDAYPNLLNNKWTKAEFIDKLKELEGWEEKTSSVLVSNFGKFITFYNKIKPFVSLEKKKEVKESKLSGITMVLSGFRDAELQEKLETIGVKIQNSVSKNTNYLVVKDQSIIDEATGKVVKAQELGIKIITKEQLIKMVK